MIKVLKFGKVTRSHLNMILTLHRNQLSSDQFPIYLDDQIDKLQKLITTTVTIIA